MFCYKCLFIPIELVKRSKNEYHCPSCHTSYNKKQIKTAQFGGVTGGTLPGHYPVAPWMGQTHNVQYNKSGYTGEDVGLDGIMSRTRKNVEQDDSDKNIESRLEAFHTDFETDTKPYILTGPERKDLNNKDQIRRREYFLNNFKKEVDENSVSYIKENFPLLDIYSKSIENLLNKVRTNIDPVRVNIQEGQPLQLSQPTQQIIPPLNKKEITTYDLPEGNAARLAAQKTRGPSTTFLSEEDYETPSTTWSRLQKKAPQGGEEGFMNHTPFIMSNTGDYGLTALDQAAQDEIGFMEESPLAWDYPTVKSPQANPDNDLPSPIKKIPVNNTNVSLENKLEKNRINKKRRLPNAEDTEYNFFGWNMAKQKTNNDGHNHLTSGDEWSGTLDKYEDINPGEPPLPSLRGPR